ncbi:MAG: hypothetical protein R2726_08710 [Acidimicrobiales bacterium]
MTENLRVMPARLVQALPVFVLAAAALVLALVVAAPARRPTFAVAGQHRRRLGAARARRVVAVAVGFYAAFGWTWQSVPVGAHPIVATRFYLPATGALALLAAWLFVRVPRWAAVAAVVVLFVVGGLAYRDAVTSGPMFQAVGTGGPTSGPGGGPGPSFPGGVGGAPGPSLPGRVGGAPGSAPSPGSRLRRGSRPCRAARRRAGRADRSSARPRSPAGAQAGAGDPQVASAAGAAGGVEDLEQRHGVLAWVPSASRTSPTLMPRAAVVEAGRQDPAQVVHRSGGEAHAAVETTWPRRTSSRTSARATPASSGDGGANGSASSRARNRWSAQGRRSSRGWRDRPTR